MKLQKLEIKYKKLGEKIKELKEEIKKLKEPPSIIVDDEDLIGLYSWSDAQKQIKLLNSLKYKGFTNWRLPSKDELDWICRNKHSIGCSNSGGKYWTSSEADSISVWTQNIASGISTPHLKDPAYFKDSLCKVRCVRDTNPEL